MKKKERDRVKIVVYEAYMAGQARGQKTEEILDELGGKFDRHPRTIQNWIYDVGKQREATQQHIQEQLRANIHHLQHELGLPHIYFNGRGLEF